MKSCLYLILYLSLSGGFACAQSDSSVNASATYNGPPPSPEMSPDDAQAYFAQAIDAWLKNDPEKGSQGNITVFGDDGDGDLSIHAPGTPKPATFDASQLGMDNLLALLEHAPGDSHVSSETWNELPRRLLWRQVALDNIDKLATDDDFSKIMDASRRSPLLIKVMKDKDWMGRPEVAQFLTDQLDELDQSHQTDPFGLSRNVFVLSAQSVNPDVIQKLIDVIKNATSTEGNEPGLFPFCSQLFDAILQTSNEQVKAVAPALLSTIAHRPNPSVDGDYELAENIEELLKSNPDLFLFQSPEGRQAVSDFTSPLVEHQLAKYDFYTYRVLALAMKVGNKKAFDQIVGSINDPTHPYTWDAFPLLLKNMVYTGPGDEAQGVVKYSDSAVFNSDTGKWTITVPDNGAGTAGTTGNAAVGNSLLPASNASLPDVNKYVNKLTSDWLAAHPNQQPNQVYEHQVDEQLAESLRSYDLNSLLMAFRQIPDGDVYLGSHESFDRLVIYFAIRERATDPNLAILIKAAEDDQRLMPIILDDKKWKQNLQLIQFANVELDKLDDLKGSNPIYLLSFVSKSQDKGLQDKLVNMARKPGAYNGHAVEALLEIVVSGNNEQLLQNTPGILNAAMLQIDYRGTDVTKTFLPDIVYVLANRLMLHPGLCGNPTMQREVTSLLETGRKQYTFSDGSGVAWDSGGSASFQVNFSVLGASIGNLPDFQRVLGRLSKRAKGEKDVTASNEDLDRPNFVQLDKNFFNTIVYNGPGDKLAGVVSNLTAAQFNSSQGRWVVNAPGFKTSALTEPAVQSQTNIRTDTVVVAPSMPATANAHVSTPGNSTLGAPETGTIISATQITATTMNGGHAAMPLSVGEKVSILSVNNDGTLTAVNSVSFRGKVARAAVSIDSDRSSGAPNR